MTQESNALPLDNPGPDEFWMYKPIWLSRGDGNEYADFYEQRIPLTVE